MRSQLERLHFLDSMRGVLMMLGVVLHSAQIFRPAKTWVIYSEESSLLADIVVTVIHTFRMPAFFMVSGLFCALLLSRYMAREFLRIRFKRIILPLISSAIFLNSLQAIALVRSGWLSTDASQYFLQGGWVYHLWFLNYLLIFILLAALLVRFWEPWVARISDAVASVPILWILLLAPLTNGLIVVFNWLGLPIYNEYFGVVNTYTLLTYLPYFAFGILLYYNQKLLHEFAMVPLWLSFLIMALAGVIVEFASTSPDLFSGSLVIYCKSLLGWFSVSLCFHVFYRFLNTESKRWSFLSDASYTVYLFHHLLVILFGLIFIGLGWPGEISMFLIIFLTIVVTLLIHKFIVLRFPVVRLLFNGK
ncbi:acyltransferase family protein [Pleionea sp. CnH1-48]|uniref:acyltransferase family protein n=1 Tax=Pleionea sp. CnH1-48 TaxID=2954494 RepID=UPI002098083C|nr:acyltransferase family protein [Pleionea sp. CnH1-48]MCO7223482.1 acyltransferase family protein [Pleionea sp. CnH1-48]